LTTRLVAGLLILKHMHNLSDEALCDRWVENWRTRIFSISAGKWCSHVAPLDRSSLTRWRQRLGKQPIAALLQESLSVAHRASRGGDCAPTDTRGSTHGRSRSWSRWPGAGASNCTRAICAWPSAPPLWWGAIRKPTCSSVPGAQTNSGEPRGRRIQLRSAPAMVQATIAGPVADTCSRSLGAQLLLTRVPKHYSQPTNY
jgi:hypothetical protein